MPRRARGRAFHRLRDLLEGDLVVHRPSGLVYFIAAVHSQQGYATAIRSVEVKNPKNWELLYRARYKKA